MTKNEARKWLLDLGYRSSYSGKERTLYVRSVTQKQLDYFNLPVSFTLKSD
jgi:hypothetical protein